MEEAEKYDEPANNDQPDATATTISSKLAKFGSSFWYSISFIHMVDDEPLSAVQWTTAKCRKSGDSSIREGFIAD